MFELEINGKMYPFKFGIGFLREINKTRIVNGEEVGFRYNVANLIGEGDPTSLCDILNAANKGQTPRITTKNLEEYIEDGEDLDELTEKVVDFLEKNNCTKKLMEKVQTALKELQE